MLLGERAEDGWMGDIFGLGGRCCITCFSPRCDHCDIKISEFSDQTNLE